MRRRTHPRMYLRTGVLLSAICLVPAVLLLLMGGRALAGQIVGPGGEGTSSTTPFRIYLPVVTKYLQTAPYTDLGDAPDSSNNYGAPMTAYPAGGPLGVQARFPTVFGTGSPPNGPMHINQVLRYYLGPAITTEKEADIGSDADGVNNIQPPLDRPDQDKADDGVIIPTLPNCQPTTLTFNVTVPAGAPASKAYVNVWFDWNRSGFWGGVVPCAGVAAPEWAVPNYTIALPGPGTYPFTTPVFIAANQNPNQCLWWRITLSDIPATNDDGRGPANAYEYGETEDYYTCGGEPTPTPTATLTRTPTPTATPTATATPTKKPPFSIIVIKLWAPDLQPLPDWKMSLFRGPACEGPTLNELITDPRGMVDFLDLEAGRYSVLEESKPGFDNLTPLCQSIELSDAPGGTARLTSLAYPPGGTDSFPSGALLSVEMPGLGMFDLTLNGPTDVRRSDPGDSDGDGLMDIRTEITAMNLVGMSPAGPVTLRQSQTRASRGVVEQQSKGADFPADSFFDVFVEIEVAGLGRVHNEEPVRVEAVIDAIPPTLAYYRPTKPLAVPLLDANGQPVGVIRNVIHIPLPPREKLIIFINHKPPTPTPTATSTLACAVPPVEMTAWWPLDETSGTTAVDIAGFPTNGTHMNGPIPVSGKVNGALSFDGIDDYVEVNDHPTLNFGTGNFSADTWIRTSDANGVKLIVDKRQEATNLVQGYSLFLSNGLLAFQLADGPGSTTCSNLPSSACTNYGSTAFVADGNWHHIAVTVNRANPIGGRFYVDGALVFTFDPTLRPGSLTNPNPLRMASRSSSVTGLLRGVLDEVELFPRVLTPAEVQSIFLADKLGKCRPTPTPTSTRRRRRRDSDPYTDGNSDTDEEAALLDHRHQAVGAGLQPLPDWKMSLFRGPACEGPTLNELITDPRGMVDFLDLEAGRYSVLEESKPGFDNLTPLCQSIELSDAPGGTARLTSLAYPPGGTDSFPSGALLSVEMPGLGMFDLTLNGPTDVRRSDPGDSDGDGLMDIRTEITAMNLVGMSPAGPVTLRQSQTRASRGVVEQQSKGADFPADSFFDVFVEIEVAGLGRVHNEEPVRVEAVIDAIPPTLAYYRPTKPLAVPLLDANGQPVGVIRNVIHIPLPPREKLIIFINHKPPTPTPRPPSRRHRPARPRRRVPQRRRHGPRRRLRQPTRPPSRRHRPTRRPRRAQQRRRHGPRRHLHQHLRRPTHPPPRRRRRPLLHRRPRRPGSQY